MPSTAWTSRPSRLTSPRSAPPNPERRRLTWNVLRRSSTSIIGWPPRQLRPAPQLNCPDSDPSIPGAPVVPNADAPGDACDERDERRGRERREDQQGERPVSGFGPVEQVERGKIGDERQRDDEGEEALHQQVVDRQRVAGELGATVGDDVDDLDALDR